MTYHSRVSQPIATHTKLSEREIALITHLNRKGCDQAASLVSKHFYHRSGGASILQRSSANHPPHINCSNKLTIWESHNRRPHDITALQNSFQLIWSNRKHRTRVGNFSTEMAIKSMVKPRRYWIAIIPKRGVSVRPLATFIRDCTRPETPSTVFTTSFAPSWPTLYFFKLRHISFKTINTLE